MQVLFVLQCLFFYKINTISGTIPLYKTCFHLLKYKHTDFVEGINEMRNSTRLEYDDAEQMIIIDADAGSDGVIAQALAYIVLSFAIIASVLGVIFFALMPRKSAGALPAQAHTGTPDAGRTLYPAPTPDTRLRVLIDAGHGGFDPGTEGTETGVSESEVNLAIALKLQSIIENRGYLVMMTRTDGKALAAGKQEDMTARCSMIERSGADVFISIHQNAFDSPSVCGCEVYYHETRPESKKLADCVEKALAARDGAKPSRGVKTYGHMLTKLIPNSILIECGFITNPYEEAELVSPEGQARIAEAIAQGIDAFFADYDKK